MGADTGTLTPHKVERSRTIVPNPDSLEIRTAQIEARLIPDYLENMVGNALLDTLPDATRGFLISYGFNEVRINGTAPDGLETSTYVDPNKMYERIVEYEPTTSRLTIPKVSRIILRKRAEASIQGVEPPIQSQLEISTPKNNVPRVKLVLHKKNLTDHQALDLMIQPPGAQLKRELRSEVQVAFHAKEESFLIQEYDFTDRDGVREISVINRNGRQPFYGGVKKYIVGYSDRSGDTIDSDDLMTQI